MRLGTTPRQLGQVVVLFAQLTRTWRIRHDTSGVRATWEFNVDQIQNGRLSGYCERINSSSRLDSRPTALLTRLIPSPPLDCRGLAFCVCARSHLCVCVQSGGYSASTFTCPPFRTMLRMGLWHVACIGESLMTEGQMSSSPLGGDVRRFRRLVRPTFPVDILHHIMHNWIFCK